MSVERTFAAQCVEFVKEKNAGRISPGLLKDRMDVLFRTSDPHIQNIRKPDSDETCAEFARDRSGDKSFTTSRRAVKQQSAAKRFSVQLHHVRIFQRRKKRKVESAFHILHPGNVIKPQIRDLDKTDVVG